jgi:hypothetical protein
MADKPNMTVIGHLLNGAQIRGDAGFIKLITRQHDYAIDRDVCRRCGRSALEIVESGLRCDEVRDG